MDKEKFYFFFLTVTLERLILKITRRAAKGNFLDKGTGACG